MLKLYIFGYLNRVQSSRRLEREAGRDLEVMWLTGRLVPDHKTIADFRKDNGPAIKRVCAQFVALCRKMGLLAKASVAIDGSKFKAVNSRDSNFTKGKMERRLAQIEERALAWVACCTDGVQGSRVREIRISTASARFARADVRIVYASARTTPLGVVAVLRKGPYGWKVLDARAEAVGCDALVVTLDTTTLGWRPWDLDLGSLPFTRGVGIAQYTSDPRFAEMVADRVAREAAAGPGTDPDAVKVTPKAVVTLLEMARNHPGAFRRNLTAPETRAAVQTFLDTFSNPALNWDHIATLRDRTRLPVVLKGILDLWVADEHYVLREGDAITFPSRLPHWNVNRGEEPATVLFCVTPPSF